MKFLLTIIWVLVWSMTYSQENTPAVQDQIVNQIGKDGYAGAVQTYDTRYEGVKGTPFLSEKWQPGSFTYNNGTSHDKVSLRYDMYRDELWVRTKRNREVIIFQNRLESFVLDSVAENASDRFIKVRYIPHLANYLEPESMVQILYEGKFMVVARRKKIMRIASYKGGYSLNRTYDEFVEIDPEYYSIYESRKVVRVKPSEKAFLRKFPTYSDAIKSYLNKYNPDFLNPDEVGVLFRQITQTDE